MAIARKIFSDLAEIILEGGAHKATKIFSEKEVVKATRKLFNGRIDKRLKRVEILFTIGSPNYAERQVIRLARKNGEPFPIKRILIQWPKGKAGGSI